MALSKQEIKALYYKRAANYDISANLYYLIGFRERSYRRMAIARLGLKEGDTVIELGCGTGLNLQYLLQAVGSRGNVIGVDLTPAMLEQAQSRVDNRGWGNVELVHCDVASYEFPGKTDAVFSSFALTLVPEYEAVIERASKALPEGGRLVLLDLKLPEKWPLWAVKFGIAITRPFGVSLDLADRKPWISMQRYFKSVTLTELYGGFAYIAVAQK